jgi:predicted nucleic acid-binding protein
MAAAGAASAMHTRRPWAAAQRARGVTSDVERKTLRRYETLLRDCAITPEVCDRAIRLADRGRASGVTLPLADLLIWACARVHGLDVAHDDAHFETLAALDV